MNLYLYMLYTPHFYKVYDNITEFLNSCAIFIDLYSISTYTFWRNK